MMNLSRLFSSILLVLTIISNSATLAHAAEADDAPHWAFVAPVRPETPPADGHWALNPIDHFILERLTEEGFEPSPAADRVTLLRRLSLDLIGLPPSIEEVDAFLADQRPNAYERQVERLLRSEHYGERWGKVWLDAACYADSDGYEKDKSRTVWFYRDWVIGALNRDLGYDRFIIEQVAGDLIAGASQSQKVATGFLRNSMINEEGGIDPEQFRMEAMFARMDAIGKGVLGLTIQCAQCHSHKYDPLSQEEYYRMFSFLNNDHEANITVYTADEQSRRADLYRQVGEIEAELRHRHSDWRKRMVTWEEALRNDQPKWTVVRPEVFLPSSGGSKYLPLQDGSFLAQGYAPTKHRLELNLRTDVESITAFRLELLKDPNLPRGGPGRSILGTGALTEFEVRAGPANAPETTEGIEIVSATADVEIPEGPLNPIYDDRKERKRFTGPIAFAIDGKEETAWSIDAGPGRRNKARKAVFVAKEPISHEGGTLLTFYLSQKHGGWNSDDNQNYNLGRIRLSITTHPNPMVDPLSKRGREILMIPPERRSSAQTNALFSEFRRSVPEWKEANDRIEALWSEHPEGVTQLVLDARETPRDTRVLRRGDFLKPGRAVDSGTPKFLHPLPKGAPPTRLTFAKWLVDRNSPTTARSIVNRVWQAYFGTGLVATSEDLGTQAEPPTHPELFDWLAVEFMDKGWRLKNLHRLIVTSATYRQSSRVTPERYKRDPFNRLLARGSRLRVDGELVRDIALRASGLLHPKVGGRSVYPPLPKFMLKPPVSYGPKVWHEETGPDRYRRALYTFRYRSIPYPALEAFDVPNGDFSCVRRTRSNTPLQALVTLNESQFVECAQALARRTVKHGGTLDKERLTYAFRCCVSRKPSKAESDALMVLLQRQKERFSKNANQAKELAATEEGDAAATIAAWTVVSRVLLNLDETITKE